MSPFLYVGDIIESVQDYDFRFDVQIKVLIFSRDKTNGLLLVFIHLTKIINGTMILEKLQNFSNLSVDVKSCALD